ncbi:kinesin-like protein KIN-14L isoform X1 [Manihot esculenta]|uniref:kinesin-like protein KIN-14L isoform X1 n=1 Tax=Manihot esculenta TaxID=3983 RepID=UPI000B5D3C04|nr:kinesin-like protein KIN-14L isoform X1 [Manihot esculenta]XP_021619929.1 kinesin-like protein KIN-14L isoform X1 [Manihot esculenta]
MENCARAELHDILTSRKAEEAAWRRFQAAAWLESLVGPLGISSHPTEKEFVSRLRNGLILCNAINKVHPGAVPKVVENCTPLQSLNRESQPLPAYQYFENVRNFLVAVEELKLPAFEASDIERDALEAGSAAKVVDCILALKFYHECKQMNGGNGFTKPIRSPMVMRPAGMNNSGSLSSDSCRCLDMSAASEMPADDIQKLSDLIVKLLIEHMTDTKENIHDNVLTFFRTGNMDMEKLVCRIMASCFEDKLQNNSPELHSMFKMFLKEKSGSQDNPTSVPLKESSALGDSECCRACLRKGDCKHRHLFQMQEEELVDLKALLTNIKTEFEDLQSKFQTDLRELGHQVQEISTAAQGYHSILKENRNLYNLVQDLKGNIRVYCRIRPAIAGEKSNAIDFIGKDGSLVILDPLKPKKDGRKMFQFNRVFGPTATQDEVYNDIQPLIRSVMDGYNVCIFAYGQTGSGKTYTMSGPSGGSTKDMGINYLALSNLFQMSRERKEIISYDIQVQMVEIYNEQVRDLLAEDSSTTKLEIRSCSGDNGLSLPDAKMYSVTSTTDVLNLMKLGETNRVVSSTAINNRSSRSHGILTVHVHGKDTSGSTLRSCLHLVDLAGSERVDKSEVTGDRLKEAQYINKSLSCLGDVITALAQKNSHVPYRNSKLTLLLQDSLGGHAKTLMFAHVSPEGDSFGETISTLKFAQRVSTVELGAARANKESGEIMQLKEQVDNLKKLLASKEQRPPCEKPKALTEQTPPRMRRLSIEKGSNMNSQTVNPVDSKRSKTPSAPNRFRRLSLEGPKYSKNDHFQTKVAPDDISKPLYPEAVTLHNYGQSQDPEAMSKMNGHSGIGSSMMELYRLSTPRSPTSSSQKKHLVKTPSMTQIPLQLPTTPESQARNTVQITMQNELALSTDFQTSKLTSSGNGKGSQIRKSLRTIGKLINGSEKSPSIYRNQRHSNEVLSPVNVTSSSNRDVKSPLSANARAMRKQSLTGVQASGFDRSRRSSLGGKPVDSAHTDESRRHARTPPPVHSSKRTTKLLL